MGIGAVVHVGSVAADLLLRNAKALHIRNVGAEGLSDGVRQFSAQKADLFKIVSLLDDCRKDLHIILEV